MRGRDRCKSSINTASLLYLWGMRNSLRTSRGDGSIDVKGGEIGLFKTLINKGFPRLKDFLSNVWQCLLTLEILVFVYEEIGQL